MTWESQGARYAPASKAGDVVRGGCGHVGATMALANNSSACSVGSSLTSSRSLHHRSAHPSKWRSSVQDDTACISSTYECFITSTYLHHGDTTTSPPFPTVILYSRAAACQCPSFYDDQHAPSASSASQKSTPEIPVHFAARSAVAGTAMTPRAKSYPTILPCTTRV